MSQRTLGRKRWRDLWRLKAQVLAIAVVIAGGVMTLVLAVSMIETLSRAQSRFYDSHHYAEVFATVSRAPESLVHRLQGLPGVNLIESRITTPVRLAVPGFGDPVQGRLTSIPDGQQPRLNGLHLLAGGLPQSGRDDQVIIGDAFAAAHGLEPGDSLDAIIEGRSSRLTISGVARSPEFLYQAGPSDLVPDYRRFALLWMNRRALADATDMTGAFNHLVLTLQARADGDTVIDGLDLALARYGGTGAGTRHDQQSHRFLEEELSMQRTQARVLPTLFLLVSAFLLHVIMVRTIRTQREQIAVLKAFGYRDGELARHYAGLAGLVVVLGWGLGIGLAAWAASAMAGLYAEYFRFPALPLHLSPWAVTLSLALAALAALAGCWRAVWQAVKLPPAEAMRPPAPQRFRRTWLERCLPGSGPASRIVLRHLGRHPVKASLSVTGIALSTGLLMMGAWQLEAVGRMVDRQYGEVLRMDVELTFSEVLPARAEGELRHLPGVLAVETWRAVPVTLSHGHRRYRTQLSGLTAWPQLRQATPPGIARPLPAGGLMLSHYLAEWLGIAPGESIEVAVKSGHRPRVELPVVALVDEPIGVGAYISRDGLNQLMQEGPAVSGAWLLVDDARRPDLLDALHALPAVAGISLLDDAERGVRAYLDETLVVFATVFVTLAGSIAFGVIYNDARISFAERARELSTLMVLGYTRLEVSRILLGEIGLVTLLAILPGWGLGAGFCWLLSQAISNDLFRIPLVITPHTLAIAAAGTLGAASLVSLLMLKRLRQLDMIAVLKAPE